MKVSVSILACSNVLDVVRKVNLTSADYLHIDFMDGKFTENKSFGVRKIKEICKLSTKPLDVHLMVKKPKKYIRKFASSNLRYMVFHIEAGGKSTKQLLKLIKKRKIGAGLAISPDTDISILEEYINMVDIILLMSVVPGKGGQKFLDITVDRIDLLKKLCDKYNVNPVISVDGGINDKTSNLVSKVDMLVAGSYITNSKNYEEQINILKNTK